MSTTITELLELFGVVTVMDVHVYKIVDTKTEEGKFIYRYGTKTLNKNSFNDTGLCLDTLKISNIKQNAAKKQFPVGLFNVPQVRVGKTVEIDMQDALGRKDALNYFFGCEFSDNNEIVSLNEKFSSLLCLEGKTWIVDLNGNKQMLWVTIPCFLPKSALNLTLQADGEAGVFDLSGTVYPVVWNEGQGLQYIIISTKPLVGVWVQDHELDN